MAKFKIWFDMQRECGTVIIEAESAVEAERQFELMSSGDVLDMSCIIPEYEIDDIEEIGEDDE